MSTYIYIGAAVAGIVELGCNVVCICLFVRAVINRRNNRQSRQPQRRSSGYGPDIRTDHERAERRRRARYAAATGPGYNSYAMYGTTSQRTEQNNTTVDFQLSHSNATTAQTNMNIQQETPRNCKDSILNVEPPPSYKQVSSNETVVHPHAMAVNVTLPPNEIGDEQTTLRDDPPPPYNPQFDTQMADNSAANNGTSGGEQEDRGFEGDSTQVRNIAGSNSEAQPRDTQQISLAFD